jgi:hypothetical protein
MNHGAQGAINGLVRVCLGFYSRGSVLGRLMTDSRFLTADPYSSWVRSIDPGGSLPFFEEKTMVRLQSRLERGPGCPRCSDVRVLAASGPILCHPSLCWCPELLSNLLLGQPINSLVLLGRRAFSALCPYFPMVVPGPRAVDPLLGVSYEGAAGRWHAQQGKTT